MTKVPSYTFGNLRTPRTRSCFVRAVLAVGRVDDAAHKRSASHLRRQTTGKPIRMATSGNTLDRSAAVEITGAVVEPAATRDADDRRNLDPAEPSQRFPVR